MKQTVTLPSYAKVNLHLDVLGKRPDGYHELLTLFERVSLADELTVSRKAGPGIEMTCDDATLAVDSSNLVVKAATGFQKAAQLQEGLTLTLRKKIPMGGGLGGGSSNAATTLLALQDLFDAPLSQAQLVEIGRSLGADVPFFLSKTPWAIGKGRGDEITPLDLQTELWHVLVTPDFAISTAQVYNALEGSSTPERSSTLTPENPGVSLISDALRGNQVEQLRENLFNALEPAVEALYPAVGVAKSLIQSAGKLSHPLLSGSGSTIFTICDSQTQAQESADRIQQQAPNFRLFVVQTQVSDGNH